MMSASINGKNGYLHLRDLEVKQHEVVHMKLVIFATTLLLANFAWAVPIKAQIPQDVSQLLETRSCSKCNLKGADLREADLRLADLRDAYLIDADLRDADLREADFRRADLNRTDLRGADLRGAYLRYANLTEADLGGANLCGATMPDGSISEEGCE